MSSSPLEPERQYSLQRDAEGESLVIPAVRIRLVVAFLTLWFGIWALVGVSGALSAQTGEHAGYEVLSALIWTLIGIYVASLLLWMTTGRETLRCREGNLEVVRLAFPLSRRWEYSRLAIADLRVEPRPWRGTTKGGAFPFFGNSRFGAVRFSYRGSTKDLALGLKESDAGQIVDWLRKGLSLGDAAGHGA